MCGICGIFRLGSETSIETTTNIMADTLSHRGPDDIGVWSDPQMGVSLGHRRLSILDLSPAGAQPMTSPCGRYVIVFNGEIYNHFAIRDELRQDGLVPAWRSTSDTETLLIAVTHWGLNEALCRLHGMFALALYDRKAHQLHLVRDRMGEKPLYLARLADGWAFGSELKALLVVPEFEARLCRDAVTSYLAYGYVPDTQCIFQNVQKIQPGFVKTLSLTDFFETSQSYETFGNLLECSLEDRNLRPGDKPDMLEATLGHVVEEQMLSDVPLGCFLSGGVDSSLVAALMQTRSEQPIHTFAIGFNEAHFNEAPHAAAVARHLGTEHTEFILSEQDALDVINDLSTIYDEPFADSSQIPTILLCRKARNSVTVALTGDGGDEVFGGYNRHVMGPKLLSRLQAMPYGLRRLVGRSFSSCASVINLEGGWFRRTASMMRMPVTVLDKVAKLAPHMGEINDLPSLYQHFVCGIHNPEKFLKDAPTLMSLNLPFPVTGAEWMMAMDSSTYLPGDILVKVDRAAMAASLETRAPFLDSRVIKAAWKLPVETKINNGRGKQVLRSILDRYVPRDLIERPKQGFAIPLDRWLRGDLCSWAEILLSDLTLVNLAGLEADVVNELWKSHQTGVVNNGTKLWTILVFLDWIRHYQNYIVD